MIITRRGFEVSGMGQSFAPVWLPPEFDQAGTKGYDHVHPGKAIGDALWAYVNQQIHKAYLADLDRAIDEGNEEA